MNDKIPGFSLPFQGCPNDQHTKNMLSIISEAVLSQGSKAFPPGPDRLIFNLDEDVRARPFKLKDMEGNEMQFTGELEFKFPVMLHVLSGAEIVCMFGNTVLTFDGKGTEEFIEQIKARNAQFGIAPPPEFILESDKAHLNSGLTELLPGVPALKVNDFPIHTSQEWTAVLQACGDGKHQRHLIENEQTGTLRHHRPGAHFYAEAKLLDEEIQSGYGVELLRAAIRELDVDAGYIMLYISECLAPACELLPNTAATGFIDLDDIARKTLGGYASNPQELERRREKVWHTIKFGARWVVGGRRSITYVEKQTDRVIDTEIYTSPWQIMSRQETVQQPLFPAQSVPVRVELVASRAWTDLTTRPDTAQYLRFGKVLGSIPGGQASGDWARTLGMAYLTWARTKLDKALSNAAPPSRRELLDMFPPKKAAYQDLLGTTNAKRIYEYWCGAEDYLKETETIVLPAKRGPKPTGAKGWQEWLDAAPPWKPGPLLKAALEEQQRRLYTSKPRHLNPAKRKPGRPPKNAV
jgi:hypothetical protein